jgi:pyruvate dehydrogenase E2 component (dihydrolipoamide acetyltransferase)
MGTEIVTAAIHAEGRASKATEVILPKLGQTMEEGTIVEWIKKEGDPVQRGELLFTVESDKAVLEVEAPARGFLRKILVPAGVEVPVLTVVALITRGADDEIAMHPRAGDLEDARGGVGARQASPAPSATDSGTRAGPASAEIGRLFASPRARRAAREQGIELASVIGSGPSGRIVEKDVLAAGAPVFGGPEGAAPEVLPPPRITPVARRAAEALGVDLTGISGTGVSGRITKADIEAAAAPPVIPAWAGASDAEQVPMVGLRRIISDRMSASATQTARVTLVTEADATELVKVRDQLKSAVLEVWGFAPGYNELLALIVARALREFPYMNARLSPDGKTIERLAAVNLGLAVDTERGLLVPVIRDADRRGLRDLGVEFRALVERARKARSLPEDLTGGTFTITNLGMYEVDAFTPIINLPEAAILGVGRIQQKPVVYQGEIVARDMWTLSLTFDHRLVDGAPAARFLQRIKQLVERPYLLLG